MLAIKAGTPYAYSCFLLSQQHLQGRIGMKKRMGACFSERNKSSQVGLTGPPEGCAKSCHDRNMILSNKGLARNDITFLGGGGGSAKK